jgi:hypothetical protein
MGLALRTAAPALLHRAAHAWMLARSGNAASASLDVLRDAVRRCLLRVSVLRDMRRASQAAPAGRAARAAQVITDEPDITDEAADALLPAAALVENEIEVCMGRYGSAVENVKFILESCPAPTHLRVRSDVPCCASHRIASASVAPCLFPATDGSLAMDAVAALLAPKPATCTACGNTQAQRVSVTSDSDRCVLIDFVNVMPGAGGPTARPALLPLCTMQLPASPVAAAREVDYDLVAVCYFQEQLCHFVTHARTLHEAEWHEFDGLATRADRTFPGQGTAVDVPDGLQYLLKLAVYAPRLNSWNQSPHP